MPCDLCAYLQHGRKCKQYAASDAVLLLDTLVPHVLTLKELADLAEQHGNSSGPVRPVFVEWKNGNQAWITTTFSIAYRYAKEGLCRAWTMPPSDELREEMPWK